jgi:hypothetical protein
MLSREVMGALALAILWVNTLLIAVAATKRAAELARMGRSFGDVRRGKVVRGDGPSGAIAALEIDQVGRLGARENAPILFHDRSRACRIFGGRVALETGDAVDLAPADDAEVWVDAPAIASAARLPSDAAFDAACVDARKARGYARSLRAPIVAGADVFVATRLVSMLDPRGWIKKRVALASAFVVAEIAVAAACTAAALEEPHFGPLSTAGAAAAFVFFLLVQPAGTAVRDALRPPSRAPRHDAWTRAAAKEPAGQATRSPS